MTNMPDQANDLRKLVRQCVPAPATAAAVSRRIVVFGGKGGVGTTTISVNLAAALARRTVRTLLIDAAGSGDAAIACRIDPRYTLADVLSGAHTVVEALHPGPSDLEVLAGVRGRTPSAEDSPAAWDRLLADLAALNPPPGAIVLDGGNHPDRTARRLWQAADLLLLVTTPETAAVMSTYASIKVLAESGKMAPIHLLVNMAASSEVAEDVYGRLAQACRRFLALPLLGAGHVPADVGLLEPATVGRGAGGPFRHLAQRMMTKDTMQAPSAA